MGKRKRDPEGIETLEKEIASCKKRLDELLTSKLNENRDASADDSGSIASLSSGTEASTDDKENETPVKEDLQTTAGGNIEPLFVPENVQHLLGGANSSSKEKFALSPELAALWAEMVKKGLDKDTRKELEKKYPKEGNCPLQAPTLNEVVLPLINKTLQTRDKYLSINQGLVGQALVPLGFALGTIFKDIEDSEEKHQLLQWLCDSSRLLCELMHELTKTRRIYIYPHVEGKYKKLLEDSEADETLFGQDLVKRIKANKAVEKVSEVLKPITFKTSDKPRGGLNFKRPPGRQSGNAQTGRQGPYPYRGQGFRGNRGQFRGQRPSPQANQTNPAK